MTEGAERERAGRSAEVDDDTGERGRRTSAAPAHWAAPETPEEGSVDRPDASVATGVIAADSRTRTELGRQRRWLLGGAVLGLLVLLAFVLGRTLWAEQTEGRARTEARVAEAEAAFASAVVDRAEGYRAPASIVVIEATTLRTALEDHLADTDRTMGEVVADLDASTLALELSADVVEELTLRELPPAGPLVDGEGGLAVLEASQQLRVDAAAMVEEIRTTTADARRWSEAVRKVEGALRAHEAAVAARSDEASPAAVAEGWRSELVSLAELAAAAAQARELPGLAAWAAAHERYATGTVSFIEEALQLLEEGAVEEYNTLFRETFDDDPFELRTGARAGAEAALAAPPVTDAAALVQRAQVVTDDVDATETAVVTAFGADRP